MNRYQRGKIYAIRSDSTDEIYIGSTIEKLSNRLSKHRANYKAYQEGKYNYVTSFKLLEYEDHYIELIELYPCTTKEELDRREGQIIRATNNTVNRFIAGRTNREYYEDNKEAIQQYKKQHYQDNREARLQKRKQYYEDKKQTTICECGSVHTIDGKARHLRTAKHQAYIESNHLYLNVLFQE